MHTLPDIQQGVPDGAFVIPPSFAQQRMWFLEQLLPVDGVYNVFKAYKLCGHLDVAIFERSINALIGRHEVLRTRFLEREGTPWQVILPSLTVPVPVVDLRGPASSMQKKRVRQMKEKEALRQFDLKAGPLLSTRLLRLADEEHILLLTMHHIICDGWSVRMMMQELSVLYAAFIAGGSSPLEDLPIQYADYAVWQREWLQGEVLECQLRYWKDQLGGLVPLHLPMTPHREGESSYRGASENLVLPASLTAQLRSLSLREGVTLFMVLLAALYILLLRYSGQEDIAVGTPIAGRNRPNTEGLIGLFINTLVLRTSLSSDPTFSELLSRVRDVCLAAYDYQDLPFEKLVEELTPEREFNRNPFFDVMINFNTDAQPKLRLADVTMDLMGGHQDFLSKFAMELYVDAKEHSIELQLVYQRDLFRKEKMKVLLEQYGYLLEQIVAKRDSTVTSITLVTPKTRRLLPDPNLVIEEPLFPSVTNQFTACVHNYGEEQAVCQGTQSWSYNELAEAAEGLAMSLAQHGVSKGTVVGLIGSRNYGTIVGMLGVLLSGGVVLPIDSDLPARRIQLMLQEAGARLVLHVGEESVFDSSVTSETISPVLCIDSMSGIVKQHGYEHSHESVVLPEPGPDDPAYIFFTSGSTGIPKGVLGCHKSLSHFLDWQRRTFDVGRSDRVTQLTSLSFDVVLRDVFLPLTSGGTVCLPQEQDEADILHWLERQRITVVHTVPSVMQSWLELPRQGVSLRTLRWLFIAGEPLNGALVTEWHRAFPGCGELVNLYGATETTLTKCYHRIGSEYASGIQPIGIPMPNTQALVLNKHQQLCGVGEPGEIALRTPFRTLGYINAPEENKKRFVANPYTGKPDDLVYLTGDQGRYREDGSLEILGRLDNQIKIRGVRVEPAEVTAILAKHPSVNTCVVVGRKLTSDENCLVAYVVLASESVASSVELQTFLQAYLPRAMVPDAVTFMDRLPTLPNGKIDIQALPDPDRPLADAQATYVAPSTPLEEAISKIWSDVLALAPISVHDNFFELDGHSLLAAQVIARIKYTLGIDLTLRTLFDSPTVSAMAADIQKMQYTRDGVGEPTIPVKPRSDYKTRSLQTGSTAVQKRLSSNEEQHEN